ncbi:MAG: class I SAM-dependent methyltransferase [Candidatus Moranbacteria bacterium]|nr:class I SAM-dependent methyltransferase [Candidatus Moranbacteria bacterium]
MRSLEVKNFYNKNIDKYANGFSASFVFEEGLDQFASFIPSGALILDVGSGLGQDTEYLAKKGYITLGIDISKEMIKYSLDNRTKGIFINTDFFKVGDIFKDDCFGGLWVSSSILTHIGKRDIGKFFKGVKKLLLPEGILGMVVSQDKFKRKSKIPFNNFSKKEITSLITENGFELIEFKNLRLEESNWFFILAKNSTNNAGNTAQSV